MQADCVSLNVSTFSFSRTLVQFLTILSWSLIPPLRLTWYTKGHHKRLLRQKMLKVCVHRSTSAPYKNLADMDTNP